MNECTPMGSHKCNVITPTGANCDKCLVDEITKLNEMGIKTVGSCCGHGTHSPMINVLPQYEQTMDNIGYKRLPPNPHGSVGYYPKTRFNYSHESEKKIL